MRKLRPTTLSAHVRSTVITKNLMNSSHIFVRIYSVLRPLQQPYQRAFLVISRTGHFFFLLDINCRKTNVSIDRLKPAYILKEEAPDSSVQSTRSGRKVRFVLPYQT
ncbi:hypothetical protein AVEN_141624-1 [Araneus ventricosus]|uniref:Uncharacterized protein n=1 Tax=Araneus ventricosus TaxID=182803 RepID=A0A4Y2MFU0_ARAVE|nr:hypothetical protein AVEN_141624-1 [Araneus ventricosus]